jgi:tRNA nucleotidyltransferase (CCA-adding enzyme)
VPAEGLDVEDPVHAQLRRAATLAAEELGREQVPVHATATHLVLDDGPRQGWVLLEAREPALDEPVRHRGPPAHLHEHADSFRQRWADDPTAAGPVVEEDGRLFVDVHRDEDTLAGIVMGHLEEANAGQVVDAALADGEATVLEGAETLVDVPEAARAALLDRRRPWERREDAGPGWSQAEPEPVAGDEARGPSPDPKPSRRG